MNIVIGTTLIWIGVLFSLRHIARNAPERLPDLKSRTITMFTFMMPRVIIGMIGAGFLAELMPQDIVQNYFSHDAGLKAVVISALLGAITPGGPFVILPICASALKAGAGPGAVMAYYTAWSLFNPTRTFGFEWALLGGGMVRQRAMLAWPVPIAIGAIFYLIY